MNRLKLSKLSEFLSSSAASSRLSGRLSTMPARQSGTRYLMNLEILTVLIDCRAGIVESPTAVRAESTVLSPMMWPMFVMYATRQCRNHRREIRLDRVEFNAPPDTV